VSREEGVLETASVSYGKATTYLPIVELLRTYFGIESPHEPRKVRERVTGKLLALDRALEPTLPVFLWLLDALVDDPEWARVDPAERRVRTIDALKRLLLRESQMQPVLLGVEDLHWIDGETQAVLDTLVESLPTARRAGLLCRGEYWPGSRDLDRGGRGRPAGGNGGGRGACPCDCPSLACRSAERQGGTRGSAPLRRGCAPPSRRGRSPGIIIALGGLGTVHAARGDFEPSIPLLERGWALGHSAGITNWSGTVGGALARALARSGRVAEALPIGEDAVRREQAAGAPVSLAHRLVDLAETYMVAGRLADALARAEEALNLARRHGDRRNEANGLHLLGEIYLKLNSPESAQAEAHFRGALTLADALVMRPLVAHCHLGLGTFYRHSSKHDRARQHLTTARVMYREMDMPCWLEQAEAEIRTLP